MNDDQLFGTDRTSNLLSLSGWLEWTTWTAATVIALAVVGLYVLLSGSAYSRMAYLVAFLVVVITVVRMGFRHQFS
ncbi:hypothetical protein A4G99_17630 [Haladaptatus sp. R4]|nr:hypothetical protein A4G99_17630 [Haladaptatus sp. R4]